MLEVVRGVWGRMQRAACLGDCLALDKWRMVAVVLAKAHCAHIAYRDNPVVSEGKLGSAKPGGGHGRGNDIKQMYILSIF